MESKCRSCETNLRGRTLFRHEGEPVCSRCKVLKMEGEVAEMRGARNYLRDLVAEIRKLEPMVVEHAAKTVGRRDDG